MPTTPMIAPTPATIQPTLTIATVRYLHKRRTLGVTGRKLFASFTLVAVRAVVLKDQMTDMTRKAKAVFVRIAIFMCEAHE